MTILAVSNNAVMLDKLCNGRKQTVTLSVQPLMNYDITMRPQISIVGILTALILATNYCTLQNQWDIVGHTQHYTITPLCHGLQTPLRKQRKTVLMIS